MRFFFSTFLCCTLVSLSSYARAPRDSDRDGIEDAVERRTGTDPIHPDTDRDGIPDGREDRNQDGRVDPGESDPRRAGLFPGGAPHIPEPLAFDLVRGLGAAQGELEVNTFVVVDLAARHVRWAPEIEWAFLPGYAIELELPLADRELEAVKVALQGTLPSPWRRFTHGLQTFVEAGLDEHAPIDVFGAYVWGQRLDRSLSYLGMAGAVAHVRPEGVLSTSAILNLSGFVDVTEWQTFGIETNTRVSSEGDWSLRFLPQAHIQLSERFRLQVGGGFDFSMHRIGSIAAARVVLE